MYCNNCGYNNADGNIICVNCGANLGTNADYQNSGYNEQANYGQQPVYGYENNYENGYENSYENGYDNTVLEKKPVDVLGIVSIILGAVGIVLSVGSCCCIIPFVPWIMIILALFLGVAGIVLGAISMKKAKKQGEKSVLGLVGLILSIVAMLTFIFSLVLVILMAVGVVGTGLAGGILSELEYMF